MDTEAQLTGAIEAAVNKLYGETGAQLQLQKTRKEFEGDYTVVVFPLLKVSRISPEATAPEL